jgi:hypothetical protein
MYTKEKEADGVEDQKLVLRSKGDQLKGHACHATLWAKRQGVGTDQSIGIVHAALMREG